jgi:hypothetical protein
LSLWGILIDITQGILQAMNSVVNGLKPNKCKTKIEKIFNAIFSENFLASFGGVPKPIIEILQKHDLKSDLPFRDYDEFMEFLVRSELREDVPKLEKKSSSLLSMLKSSKSPRASSEEIRIAQKKPEKHVKFATMIMVERESRPCRSTIDM